MYIAYSKKSVVGLIGCLMLLILTVGKLWGQTNWPQLVLSQDGVPISVEATGSRRVILIGHSMGGSVIAEAARLMPGRVIGLIGIDMLGNIEYPMTHEAFGKMIAPLEQDFRTGSRQFVGEMIYPDTDPQLREWILADISSAPPAVALSAMTEMMIQYITGEAARIFEWIRIPVITVNGDLWPINF